MRMSNEATPSDRDFLLSSEMGFGKTTESTEDTEKTATLCALRVLCG